MALVTVSAMVTESALVKESATRKIRRDGRKFAGNFVVAVFTGMPKTHAHEPGRRREAAVVNLNLNVGVTSCRSRHWSGSSKK